MSEKIKLSEEVQKDTFLGRLLLTAMTHEHPRALDEFKCSQAPGTPIDVEVDFKINGVPISIHTFVQVWTENKDNFVMHAVKRLMQEKLGNVSNKLEAIEREVVDLLHKEFPDVYDDR